MVAEKGIISCSGRRYESLTEAVTAAQSGDTLVLYADVIFGHQQDSRK